MLEIDYRLICEEINFVTESNPKVQKVTGGIKNNCYQYTHGSKNFFVKKYNQDTKFAKHLSKTRCESEYAISKYLSECGCAVVKPIYCNAEMQINIFEFIHGENLFDYSEINEFFLKKIIDALVVIHKIPVFEMINGCYFFKTTKEDIVRHLNEAITFLAEIYNRSICLSDYQNIFNKMASIIIMQPQTWGNIQMHNGNIIVEKKQNKIWFVDFEKAPPHFPQLDIISFINARDYSLETDLKIIEQYLSHFPDINKTRFYYVYDLLFVIDNLRAVKKIKKNEDYYKVVWTEQDGIRKKIYKKSNSTIGLRWNKERKETIEKRLSNIRHKIYSSNELSLNFREIITKIIS